MLATSAIRPARFSETMRRVRLEKLSAKKNWPTRRSQPSGTCQPCAATGSTAAASSARDGEASSAFRLGSGCVRSSNGQNCRLFRLRPCGAYCLPHPIPDRRRRQVTNRKPNARKSGFLEAVADAVKGFDHLEIVVDDLELLAQPLDVAVDGAIVDIDLIVIGSVHQGVAALHHAGARGQRLQDQELGDGERNRLVLPGAGVALGIHA